jgi:hypothetical protein
VAKHRSTSTPGTILGILYSLALLNLHVPIVQAYVGDFIGHSRHLDSQHVPKNIEGILHSFSCTLKPFLLKRLEVFG